MIAPDMATMLAFMFTDAAAAGAGAAEAAVGSVGRASTASPSMATPRPRTPFCSLATGRPAAAFEPRRSGRCAAQILCQGARCGHSRSGAPGGEGRRGCREADRDHGTGAEDDRAARRIALADRQLAAGQDGHCRRGCQLGPHRHGGRQVRREGRPRPLRIAIGGVSVARNGMRDPGYEEAAHHAAYEGTLDRHRGRCRRRQGPGDGVDLRSHAPLYRHQWLLSQLTAPAGRLVHRLLTLAWKSPRRSRLFTCAR